MSESAGTGGRIRAFGALTLGLGALVLPASAEAQAPEAPLFTSSEASAQLDQAIDALTSGDPESVDPTNELRHLAAALPSLEGRERRQARALLARPPSNNGAGLDDAGGIEPFGAEWTNTATDSRQQYPSPGGGFIVHYVTTSSDAPSLTDTGGAVGVPDYVEQVAARADSSETVENGDLGWPPPKSDGTRGGGDGITDIYLADICQPGACIFGYAGPDDQSSECRNPPFECFAYLVLDNDYAPEEFDYPDPDIPLSVTVAHEYNHILQFRLDTMQDGWMLESTAVWSEEQVFPDADDWLFYVDVWARGPRHPITSFNAGGGLRVYGSAVWNHWLELGAGYGPDVILDSWQKSRKSNPKDFAIGAYDLGIKRNGGPGFPKEFGRFATATAEWTALDGAFPDEDDFPDVKRDGSLRRTGRGERFALDHTAYRLLRVKGVSEGKLWLRVKAPRNVRTAIALVAREGNRLTGDVTTKFDYLPRGGKHSIKLAGSQDFERITAVVVNADGRFRRGSYTRDNERFRAGLR